MRALLFLAMVCCFQLALAAPPMRFDRLGVEDGLSQEAVATITQDAAGFMWFGTEDGLDRYDGYTFLNLRRTRADAASLSNNFITDTRVDATGRLWIATSGGGVEWRDSDGLGFHSAFEGIAASTLEGLEDVRTIRFDRSGGLWIGSRGAGLALLDLDRHTLRRFRHVASDPRRLWIGTAQGLALFDPDRGTFHNSYQDSVDSSSLPDDHILALHEDRTGLLWVGTRFAGVARWNPRMRDPIPPLVAVTSVRIFDRSVSPGTPALKLHYHDVITLDFAALDFTDPRANTFDFKLEGFERQWQGASTRHSVTYTNLPGGHYTLRVRAANADGALNETAAAIAFDVDPAPWASSPARMAYAFLGVLLVGWAWFAHRRSLLREARYRHQLEQKVLTRTREIAERNSELEGANRRLEQASLTDSLTGLGNRRFLIEEMSRLIAASRSQPGGLGRMTLMLVDLDRLKPINDQFGHEAGDQVLEQVAVILRESLRPTDRIARWGGDEFVIVRAPSSPRDGAEFAERIRRGIAAHPFKILDSRIASTSCSIGFAAYPFVAKTPASFSWEDVLNIADAALYRAKARRDAWVGWCGRATAAELPELLSLLNTDAQALERAGYIEVLASSGTTREGENTAAPRQSDTAAENTRGAVNR